MFFATIMAPGRYDRLALWNVQMAVRANHYFFGHPGRFVVFRRLPFSPAGKNPINHHQRKDQQECFCHVSLAFLWFALAGQRACRNWAYATSPWQRQAKIGRGESTKASLSLSHCIGTHMQSTHTHSIAYTSTGLIVPVRPSAATCPAAFPPRRTSPSRQRRLSFSHSILMVIDFGLPGAALGRSILSTPFL